MTGSKRGVTMRNWLLAGLFVLGLLLPNSALAADATETGAIESSGMASKTAPMAGVHAMGEFFPGDPQQSVFTGLRITFPIFMKVPKWVPSAHGVFDFGYVAAGAEAGDGDDGLGAGLGFEGRLHIPRIRNLVVPFTRLKFDFRITQFADVSSGTLFRNSLNLAFGVHLVKTIDFHVLFGGAYHNGLSTGLGLGIGQIF